MKFKILALILSFSTISISLFAKSTADSVGVENENGKQVILHKLDPKDNYYSIGRRYNVKPAAIMQFNNNASLHVGNTIKVPTNRTFVTGSSVISGTQPKQLQKVSANNQATGKSTATVHNNPPANDSATPTTDGTTQYKVSSKETLYSIARRFNTTVENIVALNNLKSTSVVAGQVLLIKPSTPAPPEPVKDTAIVAKRDSTSYVADSSSSVRRPNRFGLYEKDEKGVATWMDDASLDPNKKLVLHRTAPIGTVIKITNPMSNKTTFAKVVGRFNDNESNKDVIIVMTKGVAQALGALDKRFHVNISYGTPNE